MSGAWSNWAYVSASPSIFGNSPSVTLDGPNTTFNVNSGFPVNIAGTLKIQNGAVMFLFAPVSATGLELDGVVQTPGTYGSTLSPATNKLDQYFSKTYQDDPDDPSTIYTIAGEEVLTVLDFSTCPMVIEVVTTAPNQTVTLPLSGSVNARVQWGDGSENFYAADADQNHTYAAAGTYTINISGILTQFGNGDNPDSGPGYANADKITRVVNWGCTGLTSLFGALQSTANLVQVPSDFPPGVTNTGWMFKYSNFNQPIGTWDVSNVQRMGHMFENNTAFNQNIGAWNVSNVWDMRFMFLGATSFNNGGSPSIDNWNTANVSRPRGMFLASGFDQAIGNWNISNMTDLRQMFEASRLSHCNYNATLIGWAAQPGRRTGRTFHGGNSRYNTGAAAAARAALTDAPSSWTITDGGELNWSLTSAAGTDNQNVPINTPITPITYSFDGVETAAFTGLPIGVTGSVSSGVATISGTPTAAGVYNYSVDVCGVLTGTIDVCNTGVLVYLVDADKYYCSFAEAVAAAGPDETIELQIGSVTLTGPLTIGADQTFTVKDGTTLINTEQTITNNGTMILESGGNFTNTWIYQGDGQFIGDFINEGTVKPGN